METFCHGSSLVIKPGSVILKNRQKSQWNSIIQILRKVVKATPLPWKVMATVVLDAEGVILVDIILHGKLVTQNCKFKHLKPCRNISEEFNLKSSNMSIHDHTQV
jgi:hypothetical protein